MRSASTSRLRLLLGRLCCKSILSILSRNIDSRSDANAQQRFKGARAPIRSLQISISQRLLGDFCNTIRAIADIPCKDRLRFGYERAPSTWRTQRPPTMVIYLENSALRCLWVSVPINLPPNSDVLAGDRSAECPRGLQIRRPDCAPKVCARSWPSYQECPRTKVPADDLAKLEWPQRP
jgi:hypothetical protein